MYKDKEKQREANRLAKQKARKGMTSGMTEQGMTGQGMTKEGTYFKDGVEMVLASYVQGITGKFEVLSERPRYLTLSDGQGLDRLNQPEPDTQMRAMNFCNESEYNYHPNVGKIPEMRGIKRGLS